MLSKLLRKKADPEILYIRDRSNAILRYSPDIVELEKREWVLSFIVDELKKEHHKHWVLGDDAQFRGYGFTDSEAFCMWTRKLGKLSQAIVLDNPNPNPISPACRIKGELWLTRPKNYIALDNYKENTVNFKRREVFVRIFHKWAKLNEGGYELQWTKDREYTVPALMYIGIPTFWDNQISMDLFKRTALATGGRATFPYYLFGQNEYQQL